MTTPQTWERPDGRRPDELRPLHFELDFLDRVPHHAIIRAGQTVVLCTATVEESVPPWRVGSGKGWVTAEYAMLPGSTHTRKRRAIGKVDGRSQEIQRLIGRSLRAICDLSALGERSITIDCDVLQADGGTRTASITGGFVALASAVHGLLDQGLLTRSPLTSQVAAISVGMIHRQALLDLPYVEDSRADVDMNVVMNSEQGIIEVQGTAEGLTFTRKELNTLMDFAEAGITQLHALQKKTLSHLPSHEALVPTWSATP